MTLERSPTPSSRRVLSRTFSPWIRPEKWKPRSFRRRQSIRHASAECRQHLVHHLGPVNTLTIRYVSMAKKEKKKREGRHAAAFTLSPSLKNGTKTLKHWIKNGNQWGFTVLTFLEDVNEGDVQKLLSASISGLWTSFCLGFFRYSPNRQFQQV